MDIEHDLFQAARDAKNFDHRVLLERALEIVKVAEIRRKQIDALLAERDHFEAIAEQAIKNLETAMSIIEQLQGAVHCD